MRENNNEKPNIFAKSAAVTFGISLLISFAVMLAASWGVSTGSMPPNSMPGAAAAACGTGAFVAGLGGAALFGKRSLIAGITSGMAYFLLLYIIGAIAFLRMAPASPVVGMLAAALIGGTLAGLLGTRKKKRRG